MRIPLVDLKVQYASIKSDIDQAIEEVLAATAFVGGPFVKQFEQAWAESCEVSHAVGCNSGTDALRLAFDALGIGDGDEVILPSHTFFATAEAVMMVGATPVFADIGEAWYTVDPAAVSELVTECTKAIVPVHLYGHPCDMDPLLEITRRHGLKVVEDCAQAHGARYKGKLVGTMGDVGCFSFYPGKNLGAYGDAGAIVTSDGDIAARVAMLRDHGRSGKYEHEVAGVSSRLDGLQAAILRAKLRHLPRWNEARRQVAAIYDRLLADVPEVTCPRVAEDVEAVFHLYVVRLPRRNDILAALKEQGVGAGIHYPVPCHEQPALRRTPGSRQSLPQTEAACREILSLPLFPEMDEGQVEQVATSLREALAVGSAGVA